MRPIKTAKPWGTWYTDAGDRADAWPGEVRETRVSGPGEALVSCSMHGMAGAAGGLSHRVAGEGLGATSTGLGSLL